MDIYKLRAADRLFEISYFIYIYIYIYMNKRDTTDIY